MARGRALLPALLAAVLCAHLRLAAGKTTLVVVYGLHRGGDVTFNSLLEHVVKPYDGDVALIGPPAPRENALTRAAKYVFDVPNVNDWGAVMDAVKTSSRRGRGDGWRKICQDKRHLYLGGVKPCQHRGSGGILIAYRLLAREILAKSGILDEYDWVVYTRSDYLYLCKAPPLSAMSPTSLNVPRGEGWGGYTDRHLVVPSSLALKALNAGYDIANNPDFWLTLPSRSNRYRKVNIEKVMHAYWTKLGLGVSQFDHTGLTVCLPGEKTLWKFPGVKNARLSPLGLLMKYPREFRNAEAVCGTPSWESLYQRSRLTRGAPPPPPPGPLEPLSVPSPLLARFRVRLRRRGPAPPRSEAR